MRAHVVQRHFGSFDLNLKDSVEPIALLGGSLILYGALRVLLLAVAEGPALDCLWLDLLALAAATLLAGLRHDEFPAPLRLVARGIGAVVLAQVACDGLTLFYAPDSLLAASRGLFFRYGTELALLAGLLSLWRPAFLIPLLFHYVAYRHQIGMATGIAISETDYLSMLDIGNFAVIGGLLTIVLTRDVPDTQTEEVARLRQSACSLVWACAVGAHLGNYFISAWTKIRAGGDDPLFWLLHNPTQTSILIGLERGDNPLAAWPWLVQFSWDSIAGAGILVNIFVLGVQFAAPLAVGHRRALMALTLLYDFFHIGVYFTLGALFFFWIAVNIFVFLSVRRIEENGFTPLMRLVMLSAVMGGHFLFYTSHLGWLDGAKLASPSFTAETRDGRQVPVPAVYFGINSYSIAQTVMYAPDGHFPVRIGGNSYNRNDWRDSQSCGPETVSHQDTGTSLVAVEAMVRGTDKAMRRRPFVKEANLYYLYPHHMVPNPWMFRAFNNLSMDDVVRYHYIVESVCLGLKEGRLVRDVRLKTDYPIDAGE